MASYWDSQHYNLHVLVGTMFYMGLILVSARRQHAFGGNGFPDKFYFQGVQDLLRRFSGAVPMFSASEGIMDHISFHTV